MCFRYLPETINQSLLACAFQFPHIVTIYEERKTYIFPFIHCASSTISKLEWIINWFMYCAVSGNRKRAIPSPPDLDVPKAMLNKGTSVGERIVK